ncbi:MAG: alpha/beta hydrolase, partial [Burkholderiaceae bacterium]
MKKLARTAATAMVAGAVASSAVQADEKGDVAFQHGPYYSQSVRFRSRGIDVVGLLYIPRDTGKKHPAVVILGPFGAIKEQSPMEYATRLARDGFIALIFDPRYTGESGGEPRRLESPKAKIEDVGAALDFLEVQ